MGKTRARAFHGWWIVLISAFGMFLGPIPIVVFSFSVFLKPLAEEFHSGRAPISLALTLHNFISAFGIAISGRLVDRFGSRKVILSALVMGSAILLSSYFCAARVWELYAFFLAAGLANAGAGPVPFGNVISHWFDRRRGLALGATMLGMGCGALVMPSLAQRLIASFGWRSAYGFTGAAILLITVPIIAIFLKERPEQMGLLPDGTNRSVAMSAVIGSDVGSSLREAWQTRAFWLLLAAFVLISLSVHAGFTHFAAILSDRGSSAAAAALAASLFGGGVIAGRALTGYLLDRFFAPRVTALVFACAAAGIALLATTRSQNIAFAAALLIGFGWGTEGDAKAYLVSRYFGLRCFGEIYGFIFAGFVLAGGLGAYLMGLAFDHMRSYEFPLAIACLGALVSAVLMMVLGPYRYQVGVPVENSKCNPLPIEQEI
jgi:MFS family permease